MFQERLIAPRVLHFCRDQVAWECSEFEDAERYSEARNTPRDSLDDPMMEGRLKAWARAFGLALRERRLRGFPDPDKDMPDLSVYELWKHMVEAYPRLQLTVSRDRLTALSNIAGATFHD
jgi:hypothetical protein